MEFLLYLSPTGQQLIQHLISAKFQVGENIAFCKGSTLFGYADFPKKFVICTNNIKKSGFDPNYYIGETVYHEATHAAQICNHSKNLGLSKKNMPLPSNKMQDIKNSMKATGNTGSTLKEHEAYFLEDKPEKVLYYVKKFCF
jgi:hypothetical protein